MPTGNRADAGAHHGPQAGRFCERGSEVEAYLRQRLPALLCGRPAVTAVAPLGEEVWQVALEGHPPVVAKHQLYGFLSRGTSWDLLEVEQQVLDLLVREHCPVPRILAVDAGTQFIFYEHRGSRTLDDLAQEAGPRACRAYLDQAIAGLCRIDRVCSRRQDRLVEHLNPAADLPALRQAWEQAGQQAVQGLEWLSRSRGLAPPAGSTDLLEHGHTWLAGRQPTLGTTDYNARNLVLDPRPGRLTFVEFAKIGWDWTERRLVQYTISLGAGRPAGRFRSLMDARAARQYASLGPDGEDRGRALDWHHLLLHLVAVGRLGAALEAPAHEPHARLLASWTRPHQRLRDLLACLARPLSADPAAVALRTAFRRAGGAH